MIKVFKEKKFIRWIIFSLLFLTINLLFYVLILILNNFLINNLDAHIIEIFISSSDFNSLLQTLWVVQVTLAGVSIPLILSVLNCKRIFSFTLLEIIDLEFNYGNKKHEVFDIVFGVFLIVLISYFYMVKLLSILLVFNTLVLLGLVFFIIYKFYIFLNHRENTIEYIFIAIFGLMTGSEKNNKNFSRLLQRIKDNLCSGEYKDNRLDIKFVVEILNNEICNNIEQFNNKKIDDTDFLDNNNEIKQIIGILFEQIIDNKDYTNYASLIIKMIKSYIDTFNTLPNNKEDAYHEIKAVLLNNIRRVHNDYINKDILLLDEASREIREMLKKITEQILDMGNSNLEARKHVYVMLQPITKLLEGLNSKKKIDTRLDLAVQNYYKALKNLN